MATMRSSTTAGVDRVGPTIAARLMAFAVLTVIELVAVSFFFNFPTGLPEDANPVAWIKAVIHLAFFVVAAFAILAWLTKSPVLQIWRDASNCEPIQQILIINAVLFTVLLLATILLANLAAISATPPWRWFALYCVLLAFVGASLFRIAIPAKFLAAILATASKELLLAVLTGGLALGASELSKSWWGELSSVTLHFSHWLLSLYEPDAVMNAETKMIGIGNFKVYILPECSGYEGMGLIAVFLMIYLFAMRTALRFPHALLLLPIGVTAAWTFNAIRISFLVAIGAHVSPAIALNGFHSQAGWIGFLFVGLMLMVLAEKLSWFHCEKREARESTAQNVDLATILLAPFMVQMAMTIVERAFTPHEQWLYALKASALMIVILWFRKVYVQFLEKISFLAVAVGIAVGVLWVVTAPAEEMGGSNLEMWIAKQPADLFIIWMIFRAAGSILFIPIAEELAFRGYLYHALSKLNFLRSGCWSGVNWYAVMGSSILFGLLHQRILAGVLAGTIYALLMLRSDRLSDAIVAHMASNAVIIFAAIAFANWTLL